MFIVKTISSPLQWWKYYEIHKKDWELGKKRWGLLPYSAQVFKVLCFANKNQSKIHIFFPMMQNHKHPRRNDWWLGLKGWVLLLLIILCRYKSFKVWYFFCMQIIAFWEQIHIFFFPIHWVLGEEGLHLLLITSCHVKSFKVNFFLQSSLRAKNVFILKSTSFCF